MRRLMAVSARAGIVVTGTEVLTGRVQDANGPWIADRLLELGVELAHITICGDRPADIEAQLRFMADEGVDLIITSGGLGPTADDMTVEVVARFCGRELVLDDELEEKIADILAADGATRFAALDPGSSTRSAPPTASRPWFPGAQFSIRWARRRASSSRARPRCSCCRARRANCNRCGTPQSRPPAVQEAIAGRTIYRQEIVRMFGLPESGLAETLREAESSRRRIRPARDHHLPAARELEIVTRYEPDAADAYARADGATARQAREQELSPTTAPTSTTRSPQLLAGRRIATAESCTAGLFAARLTDRPGSSAYVMGGAVSYSNEAKTNCSASTRP